MISLNTFIQLLRIRQWIKNTFLYIPIFFAGYFFNVNSLLYLTIGFFAFSLVASSIYIFNDYKDIENDKKHPKKKKRPIASGKIHPSLALLVMAGCVISGFSISFFLTTSFRFILLFYFLINVAYTLHLKKIAIVDIIIISIGFVLRVKAGGVIAQIPISEWLVIMVFLLALFLALAKRRDDLLLKVNYGQNMRKAIEHYNLDFVNIALAIVSTIIAVAYLMYTVSDEVTTRLNSNEVYITDIFVLSGILRYLQIIFVEEKSDEPTDVLYQDRFIQITIFLWISVFFILIYFPNYKEFIQF